MGLAALLLVGVWVVGCGGPPGVPTSQAASPEYAPGLQRLLEAKLALLEELAQDPAIQEEVERASQASPALTAEEIARREVRWRQSLESDPLARSLLSTSASRRLIEFRATRPGFTEVFVSDGQGLVVAMSNVTSDYIQADEEWWQQASAGGRGHAYAGAIEYDDSSHSEAIGLYVPILRRDGTGVGGVLKALYDVRAIKAEL
jgi:hypothetical protein